MQAIKIKKGRPMGRFLSFVSTLSKSMYIIAGIALSFIMGITVIDVFLRALGHPFMGTYEMVALAGSVVIGFSIPLMSWEMGHVRLDFLIAKLPKRKRAFMNILTRVLVIILFIFIGINFFMIGCEFYTSREVSATIQIPVYPFPLGLGICGFVQAFVIFCDIVKIKRGEYE